MFDHRNVRVELDGAVALVTLDRPPVNALDRATRFELIAVFDEISQRDDIRCAVLTGAGKTFCAGADLKDRPKSDSPGDFLAHNRAVRETGNAIRECDKPVVAAVNGVALGAGLGLMAACDIYYASEEARFGMPEINVGLAGGAAMVHALFGRSTARRMFFTGVRLTAAELKERSIIEEVTSEKDLIPTAMAVAQEIAGKAPLAMKYAKQTSNMVEEMPQRDGYRMEQNFTMALSRTEDALEARTAFLEKRSPVFKGR
ncbi:enoyl-CoA hydratase/isomerase family protein [Aquibium sp. ELW1220]|uniref:enoyl-CoA hydratase/isomerase family protein n=1 Tax=Aquibium sp. ELW1220 TaxID=2976766 RepID=UPI0025B1BA42|nr:enoyl-CoA hydratase/isomerase family protein [Aquibium sp. ELW1220]MDN2581197.1 enoyl-CoA hydratase/isomerase family protein [Aquibium sp. ELW1220]